MDRAQRLTWYADGDKWDAEVPFEKIDDLFTAKVDLIYNLHCHEEYQQWLSFYQNHLLPLAGELDTAEGLFVARECMTDLVGGDASARSFFANILRQHPTLPVAREGRRTFYAIDLALALIIRFSMKEFFVEDLAASSSAPVVANEESDDDLDPADFVGRLLKQKQLPPDAEELPYSADLRRVAPIHVEGVEYLILDDVRVTLSKSTGLDHRPMTILSALAHWCEGDWLDHTVWDIPQVVEHSLAYTDREISSTQLFLEYKTLALEGPLSEPSLQEIEGKRQGIASIILPVVDPSAEEVGEGEDLTKGDDDDERDSDDDDVGTPEPAGPDDTAQSSAGKGKQIAEPAGEKEDQLAKFFASAFPQREVFFINPRLAQEGAVSLLALQALSLHAGHRPLHNRKASAILLNRNLVLTVFGHGRGTWLEIKRLVATGFGAETPTPLAIRAAPSSNPTLALRKLTDAAEEQEEADTDAKRQRTQ